MYIFEEYARRIGVGLPKIRYSEQSVVFLKKSSYEIIKINKIQGSSGKFSISRIILNKNTNCVEIEWELYEPYIKNFIGLGDALNSHIEVFIGGWEIFLIQNQSMFSEYSHDFIFKTINPAISDSQRIKNIENSIDIFKNDSSIIYNSWCEHQKFINNYSYWLAEIINENIPSSQT